MYRTHKNAKYTHLVARTTVYIPHARHKLIPMMDHQDIPPFGTGKNILAAVPDVVGGKVSREEIRDGLRCGLRPGLL